MNGMVYIGCGIELGGAVFAAKVYGAIKRHQHLYAVY